MKKGMSGVERDVLKLLLLILIVIILFFVVGPWAVKLILEPMGVALSHSDRISIVMGLSILRLFFRIDGE